MIRATFLAVLLTGCCVPWIGATATPSTTTEISTAIVGGTASWYDYNPGEAAAGPLLRELLGDWRGEQVKVCYRESCVVVTLTDFMSHPTRLIDLDRRSFAALASPEKGLLEVQITLR